MEIDGIADVHLQELCSALARRRHLARPHRYLERGRVVVHTRQRLDRVGVLEQRPQHPHDLVDVTRRDRAAAHPGLFEPGRDLIAAGQQRHVGAVDLPGQGDVGIVRVRARNPDEVDLLEPVPHTPVDIAVTKIAQTHVQFLRRQRLVFLHG